MALAIIQKENFKPQFNGNQAQTWFHCEWLFQQKHSLLPVRGFCMGRCAEHNLHRKESSDIRSAICEQACRDPDMRKNVSHKKRADPKHLSPTKKRANNASAPCWGAFHLWFLQTYFPEQLASSYVCCNQKWWWGCLCSLFQGEFCKQITATYKNSTANQLWNIKGTVLSFLCPFPDYCSDWSQGISPWHYHT